MKNINIYFILFVALAITDIVGELRGSSNKLNLQQQSNGIAVMVNGQQVGLAASVNFISGSGIVQVCAPNGSRIDCTPSFNTVTIATKTTIQNASCTFINSTDGGISYTYKFGPVCQTLPALSAGEQFWLLTKTPCPSTCTLQLETFSPIAIKRADGITDPGGQFDFTKGVPIWYDGKVFRLKWQH